MNILYDLITAQVKTGAGEYLRRILFELITPCNTCDNIHIYAIYDSRVGIAYDDLKEGGERMSGVVYCDVAEKSLLEIVEGNHIDTFFIACAQYVGHCCPEIKDLKCRVISVIHDLSAEEMYHNHLHIFMTAHEPKFKYEAPQQAPGRKILLDWNGATMKFCRWFIGTRRFNVYENLMNDLKPTIDLYKNNPQTTIVVVSDYTKHSLLYHYDIPDDRIKVLYSPERVTTCNETIDNDILSEVIASRKKYYLMVSCNRDNKNANKAIPVFERYARDNQDTYLVTVGYGSKCFENHIDLPFLSDSDLTNAYKNCYALLYPTLFEGFGYPPLEAMKYSKPVLCSYICSLPEVLGDAPIYSSPMYNSDIYKALCTLNDNNYLAYKQKAAKRYQEISDKQEKDLAKLCSLITNTQK